MTSPAFLSALLAAALIAGGQPSFAEEPARRTSTAADAALADDLEQLLPRGSAVPREEWGAAFLGGGCDGRALAGRLADERNWPALRAIIVRGQDQTALHWATSLYVGYQPRWTAAQYARRLRERIGAGEPVALVSDEELDGFLASRDKRLASELASALMASPSADAAEIGCRLAGMSGNRELAGQLLGLLREHHSELTQAAAGALATLRAPGPLPGVADRQLVRAISSVAGGSAPAARQSIEGLRDLAAALPEETRGGLPSWLLPSGGPQSEESVRTKRPEGAGDNSADDEAREQLRRGLRVFDSPAQMDLNWGACLTATALGLEPEACRTARMLLLYDYEHPGYPGLSAVTAAKFKSRYLVPDLAASVMRSDAALGTRIWALGEIGDPAAVPTLVEVGLDPRWVVAVSGDLGAEGPGFSTSGHEHGGSTGRKRLLIEVTSEALTKITGHRPSTRSPEELASEWRSWYSANRKRYAR